MRCLWCSYCLICSICLEPWPPVSVVHKGVEAATRRPARGQPRPHARPLPARRNRCKTAEFLFPCCTRREEAKAYASVSATAAADAAAAKPPRAKMARAPPTLKLPSGQANVLSSIRLADVLGESPHSVVRLAHTQTIADALSILAQHNILSAPGARLHLPALPRSAVRTVPRAHICMRPRFRACAAAPQRAPPRPTARERAWR